MTAFEAAGDDRRPRVVVLEHHERVRLGALAPALEDHSRLRVLRGYRDPEQGHLEIEALIASGEYDGLIALGSPDGVYDADHLPYLHDSLRIMADALRRGAPVLGLCLGSQMLAHLAGARVFPGSERGLEPEVGYFPLRLTEAGAADPVMAIYADPPPVLFWHRDTHDLPRDAVRLAATDLYATSAFRLGRWAYGVQFHLETTADLLPVWVAQSPLPAEAGVNTDAILEDAARFDAVVRERGARLAELFTAWAAEYAREPDRL